MDSPMLAERGWCTAGSSRGKRTDTSGCSGGEGRGGAERGGVEGGGARGARVILKSTKAPVGGRGALSDIKPWRDTVRARHRTAEHATRCYRCYRRPRRQLEKGGKRKHFCRQMAAGSGTRFTLRGDNCFGFRSKSGKMRPTGVRHSSSWTSKKKRKKREAYYGSAHFRI